MKIAELAMKRNETKTETMAKHKREKRKKETKNSTDIERRENYLSLNNLKYGGVFGHIWLPHTHTPY